MTWYARHAACMSHLSHHIEVSTRACWIQVELCCLGCAQCCSWGLYIVGKLRDVYLTRFVLAASLLHALFPMLHARTSCISCASTHLRACARLVDVGDYCGTAVHHIDRARIISTVGLHALERKEQGSCIYVGFARYASSKPTLSKHTYTCRCSLTCVHM